MSDCVFCKIVAGDIPCVKVYEDASALAFMDIGPIAPGHALLVPRKHYETMAEMPADEAAALGRLLPRLAAAVQAAAGAEGINILQNNGAVAGQEVPHLHVHFIPRRAGDGLGYRWPAKKADPEVLRRRAEAVRSRLGA